MGIKSEVKKATEVLNKGGTILYPTDTVWGIGCDATNTRAVNKIYELKVRVPQKSLIILVSDVKMLEQYVENIPDIAFDLIKNINEPLTIIYDQGRNVSKDVTAPDKTIAIRIPKNEFCNKLLVEFKKPITSTSANISGDITPLSYSKISDQIKNSVDYIVKVNRDIISRPRPSTIIKIQDNGEIEIIRN